MTETVAIDSSRLIDLSGLTTSITLTILLTEDEIQQYCNMVDQILGVRIFDFGCIGYWALGNHVKLEKGRMVRLLHECKTETEEDDPGVVADFHDDRPLPSNYWRLDDVLATQIVNCGIRLYGVGFITYEAKHGGWEAEDIDTVIQTQLFGEERY